MTSWRGLGHTDRNIESSTTGSSRIQLKKIYTWCYHKPNMKPHCVSFRPFTASPHLILLRNKNVELFLCFKRCKLTKGFSFLTTLSFWSRGCIYVICTASKGGIKAGWERCWGLSRGNGWAEWTKSNQIKLKLQWFGLGEFKHTNSQRTQNLKVCNETFEGAPRPKSGACILMYFFPCICMNKQGQNFIKIF